MVIVVFEFWGVIAFFLFECWFLDMEVFCGIFGFVMGWIMVII